MDAFVSVDKKTIKKISIIAGILIFIIIIFMGLYIWLFNSSKIFPNVYINSVNVGRLAPREAESKINRWLEGELDSFVIRLVYGDNVWSLTHKDMELNYFTGDSIEKAYEVGRKGNHFHRMRTILSLRRNPRIIKLIPDYNLPKIENKVDEISKIINKSPVDAKIERKDGNFIITGEIPGAEIEKEILKYNISTAINNINSVSVNIETKSIKPRIVKKDLKNIEDLIGESFTSFNSQDKGRTENIKIAAGVINSTVLMPEEDFSFNDSTGPRNAGAGYKEASVIVDGEFTTGIGGGVCQVSTTLYQMALKSDMEIISRQNHGLPVSYVPMGQDATVAYGYIDFKFKNNKEYPVYIEGLVEGSTLYMRLYGKKTNNIYINLESRILEVIEPKMQIRKDGNMYLSERKVGKSGKKGYRIETYKVYLQEGLELRRELVSKDYYPPRGGIIIEGMKQMEPEPEDLHENLEDEEDE